MSLNEEIANCRRRLAAVEKMTHPLESGIDVDIDALRSLLDKHEAKSGLKIEQMSTIFSRLYDEVQQLRSVEEKIALLKKDLGE